MDNNGYIKLSQHNKNVTDFEKERNAEVLCDKCNSEMYYITKEGKQAREAMVTCINCKYTAQKYNDIRKRIIFIEK